MANTLLKHIVDLGKVTESDRYSLEVIAHKDGFKDYDTLQVNVKKQFIKSIVPNPSVSQNNITVEYEIDQAISSQIKILNNNVILRTVNINLLQTSTSIDISSIGSGNYIVGLYCDGVIVDSEPITVVRW
jgi:hypothetical protein